MTELLFLASKTQRKAAPCLRPVFYEKGSTEGPHVAYRFFPQKQRFYQLESKTYAFTAGKQVYVLAAAHLAGPPRRQWYANAAKLGYLVQKGAPLVRMSTGNFTPDRSVLSLFTGLQILVNKYVHTH